MAKGNMLLGLSRGSVGDLTFYRRNAQQIARVRVRKVKNPQTNAQMIQRTINRTAVAAYGVLKEICNHSFEGISYGAKSYSEFLRINMNMLRVMAAENGENTKSYLPKGFNGLVAMPFQVSSGSLSFVVPEYRDNLIKWNKAVPVAEPTNMTYADFAALIGAQQGDQLTILHVRTSISAGVDEPFGAELLVARIILDPRNGEFAETNFLSRVAEGENIFRVNDPNLRNEGVVNFSFETPGGTSTYIGAGITDGSGEDEYMAGCAILSRQSPSGDWLRSKAVLGYDPLFNENGYTLRAASLVSGVDIPVTSDWYLNNAE